MDVGPEKTSKIVAYGPGLEGGVVNQPACFTVETNGETGALGNTVYNRLVSSNTYKGEATLLFS